MFSPSSFSLKNSIMLPRILCRPRYIRAQASAKPSGGNNQKEPPFKLGIATRGLIAGASALILGSATLAHAAIPFFPPPESLPSAPSLTEPPATEYVLPGKSGLRIPASVAQSLSPDEIRTVGIFEANKESVVNITNIALARDRLSLDVFEIPRGTGSGFVWDKAGHIVTNYHVVDGASGVQVTLLDQTTWPASIVGGKFTHDHASSPYNFGTCGRLVNMIILDPDKDIAVLQLKADAKHMNSLRPVSLGSSASLLVGQRVFAIGQPFGLDHTLTSGIVSGLGREIGSGNTGIPIRNVIQSDAAINPGNSGGPMLDSSGRVIGVSVAILDPSGRGSYSGVGFSLPIDAVKSTVAQLIQFGRVIRPSLGITIAPQTALSDSGLRGVLVFQTAKNGPADQAGIKGTTREGRTGAVQLGDVIVGIDGRAIESPADLYRALDEAEVGQVVAVDVLRGGERPARVQVKLMDREAIFRRAPEENRGVTE